MPVDYRCDYCGQRIQVSSRLVGKRIVCPHCRQPGVVPQGERQTTSAASRQLSQSVSSSMPTATAVSGTGTPPPFPSGESGTSSPTSHHLTTASHDFIASHGKERPDAPRPFTRNTAEQGSDEPGPPAAVPPTMPRLTDQRSDEGQARDNSVPTLPTPPQFLGPSLPAMGTLESPSAPPAVPRPPPGVFVPATVIVMQGMLLAMVAVAGVATGWMIAHRDTAAVAPPVFLTGNVRCTLADGSVAPDNAAVVLLLPAEERPASRERLAAGDLLQAGSEEGQSVQERIRSWGGDLCRVQASGFYYLRAIHGGTFYVLFLSSRPRTTAAPLDRQVLAELGRFVDRPHELLSSRRFLWQQMELKSDHTFDVTLTE